MKAKKKVKPDPSKFTSVLENITKKIQDTQPTLEVAREWIAETVKASSIDQEDKDTIIKTIYEERITHLLPIGMGDRSSLVTYLINSILKYKGLGVLK